MELLCDLWCFIAKNNVVVAIFAAVLSLLLRVPSDRTPRRSRPSSEPYRTTPGWITFRWRT